MLDPPREKPANYLHPPPRHKTHRDITPAPTPSIPNITPESDRH
ncbi:hypothetical protein SPLC1_S209040 [Arthrospira platensis C1]|nr:hypothetical protein SPLC1_S209040 [Arthrospira platensis C1]